MAVWPVTLPPVTNAGGAREVPPANVARSSLEGSFALARRRYADSPRAFAEGFVMTAAQLDTFDAFFGDDLAEGALSFTLALARTGATARLRIQGRPVYQPRGGDIWQVDLGFVEIPT